MAFVRITVEPNVMGGVPRVRGLRFPVATVVAMVADGMTVEEILAEHPDLVADDTAETVAASTDLPLCTRNPDDVAGLDDIVTVVRM